MFKYGHQTLVEFCYLPSADLWYDCSSPLGECNTCYSSVRQAIFLARYQVLTVVYLVDCPILFMFIWNSIRTTTCSTFNDIFNEPGFIKSLEGDVHIVSDLPESLQSAPRARKHFTSWSGASYYEDVKELWKDHKVVFNSDTPLATSMHRLVAVFFCHKKIASFLFNKTRHFSGLSCFYFFFVSYKILNDGIWNFWFCSGMESWKC